MTTKHPYGRIATLRHGLIEVASGLVTLVTLGAVQPRWTAQQRVPHRPPSPPEGDARRYPDRGDTEFSLDAVVAALEAQGIPAYVEMTGGGVATIYAGEAKQVCAVEGEPHYNVYPVLAGPGWFDGPNYTDGRASTGEFYVGFDEESGMDNGADNDYMTLADESDGDPVATAVRLIADHVHRYMQGAK